MSDETYKSFKSFIELKAKHIRAPLVADERLIKVLQNQERYTDESASDLDNSIRQGKGLTQAQLKKILAKVNLETRSHLGRIFTRQAIHEIALQAVNTAKQAKMERLDKFLELNRILLPFDIPDLNSNSGSGSNIHGLLITQKEQLLELVNELPSSADFQLESVEEEDDDENQTSRRQSQLLEEYDDMLKKLRNKTSYLAMLEQKLKYYDGWHRSLERTLTTDPAASLQKNLVKSSNNVLVSELTRAKERLATIKLKLHDGEPKKLQISNLESIQGTGS
ncbi:unnamed protein product [Kuraishia capsulata CBS 1993]|uniref:Uncharacterized protein n=1 Tax=Kuraishia capsulata CBS 1993 TaxID=1382522 RepID=W6MUQ1_9ASCO|nr:uncharacterized protein KUCA_T00005460001 [Kuraishia capsulata CBS 1993]CDK29472.1 unnamed protein product [Kuraishia capsulata CBS 1993]